MTIMTELDELIDLLEAEIPANPESPRNQKLAAKLEKFLAKYFKKLETAFPYSKIDHIHNKYIKESLGSDAANIINPILATFDSSFTTELEGELVEIYLSGQAEMITWGKTKGGIPITYEGPPIKAAIDWAKSHVSKAKLVDGLNEETRRQISNIISDGILNKRGIPGIKSDIRHSFNWMARGAPSDIKGLTLASRAEMIARTETANALSQASLDSMADMGIEGKEWVVSFPCDICLANENDGIIPVSKAFTSGDMAPPAHPNCRCAIAPARIRK